MLRTNTKRSTVFGFICCLTYLCSYAPQLSNAQNAELSSKSFDIEQPGSDLTYQASESFVYLGDTTSMDEYDANVVCQANGDDDSARVEEYSADQDAAVEMPSSDDTMGLLDSDQGFGISRR